MTQSLKILVLPFVGFGGFHEDQVTRMSTPLPGSVMPWASFKQLSDQKSLEGQECRKL